MSPPNDRVVVNSETEVIAAASGILPSAELTAPVWLGIVPDGDRDIAQVGDPLGWFAKLASEHGRSMVGYGNDRRHELAGAPGTSIGFDLGTAGTPLSGAARPGSGRVRHSIIS